MRNNGDHPGEVLSFLGSVGHTLVRAKEFARAQAYYDLALEFAIVYGEASEQVKELRKGLQACAKSDPRRVRGL